MPSDIHERYGLFKGDKNPDTFFGDSFEDEGENKGILQLECVSVNVVKEGLRAREEEEND
jgi:hypothetical protein